MVNESNRFSETSKDGSIEAQIVDLIRRHGSFLVCSHKNPDGDAVGSSVAIALFLIGEGKEVFVHNQSPISEMYRSFYGVELIQQQIPRDKTFEVSFLLDCGTPSRVGEVFEAFPGKGEVVAIDHHPAVEPLRGVHLIRSEASATGEILYEILRAYGAHLTPEIATALYMAVMTDTGSFRFSNTTANCLSIAAELMEAGADHRLLIDQLYENYPPKRFLLLGRVLRSLSFLFDGKVATLQVPRELYEQADENEDLTEGFVNIPRSIRGVEVAMLFKELAPGEYRVSLRSRGKVDVGALASKLKGGGHHNAAGCTLYGNEENVYQIMIRAVGEAIS